MPISGPSPSVVDIIPTLTEIEASTVLAKEAVLERVLGLSQENHEITNPVYSATGKMTSCRITIYPSAADCVAHTNATATYAVTATYDIDDNLAHVPGGEHHDLRY